MKYIKKKKECEKKIIKKKLKQKTEIQGENGDIE